MKFLFNKLADDDESGIWRTSRDEYLGKPELAKYLSLVRWRKLSHSIVLEGADAQNLRNLRFDVKEDTLEGQE